MRAFEGDVALVTGAAQGIGAALAAALAGAGARVVVSDVQDTASTVQAIRSAGGQALGVRGDVTDNASIAEVVEAAEAAFGPIGILVNNAGLFANLKLKPFLEIDEREWDQVFRVNVRGVFQVTKAVVPSMRRNGKGSIINIGSGTLFRGAPLFLHYVASKGALFAMSRSMARELADSGIRSNCITVGFTVSKGVLDKPELLERFQEQAVAARMIKRDMQPADLCGTVLFLASDASAFLTGQAINVDGGAALY